MTTLCLVVASGKREGEKRRREEEEEEEEEAEIEDGGRGDDGLMSSQRAASCAKSLGICMRELLVWQEKPFPLSLFATHRFHLSYRHGDID